MRRRNQQARYPRTGMRHIGDILPNVLAQYSRSSSDSASTDSRRRQTPPAKPTQQTFSFAR